MKDDLSFIHLDQAESIPCPLDRVWSFEQNRPTLSPCQPKAFHPCSSSHTFQLSYNNRCPNNQGGSRHLHDVLNDELVCSARRDGHLLGSIYRWKHPLYHHSSVESEEIPLFRTFFSLLSSTALDLFTVVLHEVQTRCTPLLTPRIVSLRRRNLSRFLNQRIHASITRSPK